MALQVQHYHTGLLREIVCYIQEESLGLTGLQSRASWKQLGWKAPCFARCTWVQFESPCWDIRGFELLKPCHRPIAGWHEKVCGFTVHLAGPKHWRTGQLRIFRGPWEALAWHQWRCLGNPELRAGTAVCLKTGHPRVQLAPKSNRASSSYILLNLIIYFPKFKEGWFLIRFRRREVLVPSKRYCESQGKIMGQVGIDVQSWFPSFSFQAVKSTQRFPSFQGLEEFMPHSKAIRHAGPTGLPLFCPKTQLKSFLPKGSSGVIFSVKKCASPIYQWPN